MSEAAGARKANALREAGFSSEEIELWKSKAARSLQEGGFSEQDVGNYFGVKEPDMAPVKEHVQSNLAGRTHAPEQADSFLKAVEAGFEMSVTGLALTGKPDTVLPEDAPMFYRIASQVGTLAGDLPAMVAGAAVGAPTGASVGATVGGLAGAPIAGVGAIPGLAIGGAVGATVGGGAGAFALPAAMRELLMQKYEKGEIHSFEDFWERTSAVFLEATKAGFVGGLTSGAGGAAATLLGPAVAPAVKATAVAASEIATMVTVGKALEGQTPNAEEFLDAAILIGGLHGSVRVATKLRQTYAKTGLTPSQVYEQTISDPVVLQDLLAEGKTVPRAFESMAEIPKTDKTPARIPLAEGVEVEPLSPRTQPERVPKPEGEKPLWAPSKERESAPLTYDEAYRRFIDDLHPLKSFTEVAGGREVPTFENPYDLARLTRGTFGKADQFLELSPFKFETLKDTGSKPIKKILEPFKNDLDGFRDYAVSKRALELEARGVRSGIDPVRAKEITGKGSEKYQAAFDELVKYQNDLTAYLRDSGVVSESAYKAMVEANQSYVPFFRLMEKESTRGTGKGLAVHNPVKEIKGSERIVIDPIESIIKNTYSYITLAERNRVLTSMVALAEKSPAGKELMEKVPANRRPIEVKAEEVQRFLDEHGIDAPAEAFTIFRPEAQVLAKDEIAVFRSGKREVYKVAPEVAEAVRALDKESMSLFFRIMAKPAQWLRAGSTLAPDFITRNALRDQLTAFTFSHNGFIPGISMLDGLGSLLKKDSHYSNWLKSGGANAAMVSIDRQYIQQNIFKLSQETGLIDRTWNVVKSPIEMLRVTSELIENSTRLGEFKLASKGDPGANRIFNAGLQSREVTLDFARIGAKTRAVNAISAFWNAHIQGLDRTARAFGERPLQTTAKLTAAVTVPSVLLWWANHDDPRWQEIPRWQKDLFWIVMTEDHIYRIPKPGELGVVFGSLPERVLESYFTDHPNAMKDFGETIAKGLVPEYMPTAVVPFVEHFANRSTFTQRQIVPSNLEGLLPKYQFTEYTSETAKMLGKMIGYVPMLEDSSVSSPAVIENYINAWSGNMGRYALSLADKALFDQTGENVVEKPASALADIPVIKAFVIRYPSASAQSIQDFYDRHEKIERRYKSVEHLNKTFNFTAAEVELDQILRSNLPRLTSVREGIGNLSQMIHAIHVMPDMSADEKRQQIDMLYSGMIESARLGNEMLNEIEDANP